MFILRRAIFRSFRRYPADDTGGIRGVLRDVHQARPGNPQYDLVGVQVIASYSYGLRKGGGGR